MKYFTCTTPHLRLTLNGHTPPLFIHCVWGNACHKMVHFRQSINKIEHHLNLQLTVQFKMGCLRALTEEIGHGFKYWKKHRDPLKKHICLILRSAFKYLHLVNILFPWYSIWNTKERSSCYFNSLLGFKIWPYFDTIICSHIC